LAFVRIRALRRITRAAGLRGNVVVLGERHLRHVLLSNMKYYNEMRTHSSLDKDAPFSRAIERAGQIL
jgi:hypothetical protein